MNPLAAKLPSRLNMPSVISSSITRTFAQTAFWQSGSNAVFTISFKIRSVYYRHFTTREDADRFFARIAANCHIHTIMYFDDCGDVVELA
jgi:hypothetical protein